MPTRATAIVSAVAGVLAIHFLAPPALARANKGCGARHHGAADGTPRTQCRTSVSHVFSRPPPRMTLGIGDVVSVTIFEAEPGGRLIPSDAGARPGNFITLPNRSWTPTATSPCRMRARSEPSGERPSRCRKRLMKR
jgi:hypothetical protein